MLGRERRRGLPRRFWGTSVQVSYWDVSGCRTRRGSGRTCLPVRQQRLHGRSESHPKCARLQLLQAFGVWALLRRRRRAPVALAADDHDPGRVFSGDEEEGDA